MTTPIKAQLIAVMVATLAPLPGLEAQSNYATPYTFTTLAGNAPQGSADGSGATARFYHPYGVAADSAGNVFVADTYNHTIRKITKGGTVTTIAGTAGSIGSADGVGSDARFNNPHGVAVDSNGDVFVADTSNQTIRKITHDGVVTTLAGAAGTAGFVNEIGTIARFAGPFGVAVDGTGNVYVADTGNNAIRKITPSGSVTTVAGGINGSADGTGGAARFNGPTGVALDNTGNIYVADAGNEMLRKITPNGVVTTLVGTTSVYSAVFSLKGVAVDGSGNIYLATEYDHRILRVTSSGSVSPVAGIGGYDHNGSADGTGSAAQFSFPAGIAVDGAGNLYVADTGNQTIRKIAAGGVVTTIAGVAGSEGATDAVGSAARFYYPAGVAVDTAGNTYVADLRNHTVRKITIAGSVSTLAGTAGSNGRAEGTGAAARFDTPLGVAVDASANVYVADSRNYSVRKITPAGVVTTLAGGTPGSADGTGSAAQFTGPTGVATDGTGNIYVTDANTVRKITPAGVVTTLAGNPSWDGYGSIDGTGQAARFHNPKGLTVDGVGNLYVADASNQTIRKVTSTGVVTTFAGAPAPNGPWDTDGSGSSARFGEPTGIAVDRQGNLYVSDNIQTIRKITADGKVTTLAGITFIAGSSDGTGRAARFNRPSSVAVDADGNLYVADNSNHTIRKGVMATPPTISTQPISVAVTAGWTASLSVKAAGGGLSYQWRKNGAAVTDNASATTATLTFDRSSLSDSGNYDCVISNDAGSVATSTATLTVNQPSTLTNIATRAYCSTDNKVTIGGFVVSGSANKRVLVRAVGPSLTAQGIGASEVLLDPTIEVHDAIHGNSIVATNDNLADNSNAAEIAATASAIGASALLGIDTKSSALLLTLAPGVYSFVVNGKAASSGVVLLEVYDADTTPTGSTFTNIATRAYATTGNGVTIGGFVLSGNAPKHVLLRAIGPTLVKQGLGVSEILTDPTIELHDAINGNVIIATNDNWTENADAVRTTGARIGASPIDASDTTSSAIVTTLSPGVYSFVINGKASTTGIVLVEIYDAD